ncbi:MAG: nucleotidyltransferase domain-containing protein [Chitinispirillales bacterium]|jgi:predicted nucleotidyltransferase|nr:nucleotidyltransferase domain-containing protein [Chitinispirillales bacterium]
MYNTQNELIDDITPVLHDYPVKRAALFGSYARNEQRSDSDVDLLIDLGTNEKFPVVDYVFDMVNFLENKLNLHIDLVTVRSLKSNPSLLFRENIERESRWFYEI